MALRVLLATMLIVLTVYTAVTIAAEGIDFLSPYLAAIRAGGWQGQFNVDFGMLLILAALWTAWRNGFSAGGMALALLPLVLGTAFVTTYLLYLSWRERGNVARMLVGYRLGSFR